MGNKLYYNALPPLLLNVLKSLMAAKEFEVFRLVGGTALSLYRGHRVSVDIDLFSDAPYNSIDFGAIDAFLRNTFSYVDTNEYKVVGPGKSYYIGDSKEDCFKLDLFYTDKFIQDIILIDGIRLATIEEIIAMKIDIISRGGRKKDFWDVHELKDDYSIYKMLDLHKQRNPDTHDGDQIRRNFTNFKNADDDFDPICLKGKYWEIIKLDIIDFANASGRVL
ncbi:MAG: nucleotidyl transferase AbiEii/AbiGii toxin family protein [Bacteroidales bacterium]